jgi:hypothetical protein
VGDDREDAAGGDEDASPRRSHGLTRRGFLASVGGAAVGAGALAAGLKLGSSEAAVVGGSYRNSIEPFYGAGPQSGIVTPAQSSTYFASLEARRSAGSPPELVRRGGEPDGWETCES